MMSHKNFYHIKLYANDAEILQSLHFSIIPKTVEAAVLQSILHQVEQQKIERQESNTQSRHCQLSFFDQLEEQEGN